MRTLRGTPKHLSRTGQLSGFKYLMLSLPFKCNYRCLKCFNLTNNQPTTGVREITISEIQCVIEAARVLGGRVVVIAGEGEPTLDRNIQEIVSMINGAGMIPIIYSNGSTLTSRMADFYRENDVCLVIALDSLVPALHKCLMGTKTELLPLVLKNLTNLRRLYAGTIEDKEGLQILRLALNMTMNSPNKGEVEAIKAYAGTDMYFICNPLNRIGNAEGNWSKLIESEQDFALQQELARKHSESGGPLTLDKIGVCGYSINGIGIGAYGHYMTCAYTMRSNGLLGTIRDRSLKEVYELKSRLEREHYAKNGIVPCLVRASSFHVFLETLSAGASK